MDKSLLSEEAQSNLAELAAYLKSYAKRWWVNGDTSGGNKPIGFDLERFFQEDLLTKRHECGTSACAIGHFALMRGFYVWQHGVFPIEGSEGMTWADFSTNIIGVSPRGNQKRIWHWLFSSYWSDFDNTALGVVARIEYFLEHGVPDEFSELDLSDDDGENADQVIDHYLDIRQNLEAKYNVI